MKAWISAMRLRTLPLAASSILAGTAAAGAFDAVTFVLTLLTCLSLQILSNLANDFGDYQHGTDNDQRVGPQRAMQSGAISYASMKRALTINSVISLLLGLSLLWHVFGRNNRFGEALGFLALGIGAIAAALKYTAGKNPYGYKGLGDLFVLIFFGWVGVGGSAWLQNVNAGQNTSESILPLLLLGTGIGLLATMVLNLNNLRDHVNDAASGKRTLVVMMGFNKGRIYHLLLWLSAILCVVAYFQISDTSISRWWPLLIVVLLGAHLVKVMKTNNPRELDPLLKVVALGSFVFSCLLLVSQL